MYSIIDVDSRVRLMKSTPISVKRDCIVTVNDVMQLTLMTR